MKIKQNKKKKKLKRDYNNFIGKKKKNRKKKALKSDQNVFRTFCSAPYPPREYVNYFHVNGIKNILFGQENLFWYIVTPTNVPQLSQTNPTIVKKLKISPNPWFRSTASLLF